MRPNFPHPPAPELARSAAAQRVGALAESSNLLWSHFEHRFELPLPEDWEPQGRPDLGLHPRDPRDAGWQRGVLPETKFRTFRLDRLIASFHPGHGPKWTAHELLHGLVGFGWAPGMSRLWHAQAARLAEVLPVALWYFHDEADLRRCARHAGGGALFGVRCRDCDDAASQGPSPETDKRWHERGREYVQKEIDAAWRSLKEGQSVPNRHGPLELGSDGLAYASAHGALLQDEVFFRYLDLFFDEGVGWQPSIEALIARVQALQEMLVGGKPAPALSGSATHWVAQDVGWRLLQVMVETEGECAESLDQIAERLADNPTDEGLLELVESYTALHDDWVLPAPEELFAVGYPLPGGLGHSLSQLEEGVRSALPGTTILLGGRLPSLISEFSRADHWERKPIGDRFAAFLADAVGGAAADQARLESTMCHLEMPDPDSASLPFSEAADDRLRLPRHVRLFTVNHAVSADPEMVEAAGGLPELDPPLHLAAVRRTDGEVELLELEEDIAEALRNGPGTGLPDELGLTNEAAAHLAQVGVLVPVAWR